MRLLNKLTINNLKLNKKRTIVTIVGIMLSVALITAVAAIYSSGIKSLIDYEVREKGYYHVAFFDMHSENAKALKDNRAIDAVSLVTNIGYAEIDSQNAYKPYVFIKAFTQDSMHNLPVRLLEGRLPENENEILISNSLQTNGGVALEIGDTITLEVGKRVTADGYELNQNNPYTPASGTDTANAAAEHITDTVSRTYTVTGIMERPTGSIESYSAPGYTLITRMDEDALSGNTDVYVHFKKASVQNAFKVCAGILGIDEELFTKAYVKRENLNAAESLQLAAQLAAVATQTSILENGFQYNESLILLETDPSGVSSVSTLAYAVYTVIAIIVLASIFCIKNSFDISIAEKIRQYGVLRSIGATKAQIRKNVFVEATILGAFGIPLGIILGFLASYILVIISNLLLTGSFGDDFTLKFVVSWWAVLVAVLMGIVTVYLSALRSALKASRVTPLDSIRNSAEIMIKAKKLRVPKILGKIFGIGGEISYKNLKRNKKKYRTTVISIAVSVTVFVALSAFMDMAIYETNRELERSEYNINVTTSYTDAEEYQRLVESTHLDYVQDASVLREDYMDVPGNHFSREYTDWTGFVPDETFSQTISIEAVGNEQFAKYCRSLGLDPENMKEKAILCDYDTVYRGDKYEELKDMRIYNYKKGDVIEGIVTDFLTEAETTAAVEIAAVSNEKPFGLKLWGGNYLFVSDELFDQIANTRWVRICYKSDNSDKLQEELEAFFKGTDYNLTNTDENYRQANNVFTLVGIFLYGFIIVISLIGITNIFNTITTNMELRKPEFAMLRSVGMTNHEFNRMIRLESLFMGIRSLLFGIPVGILLAYLIYHFLTESTGAPFRPPVTAILIAVAAVFALIFLIMTYSIGKIKKQNIIETIRNENI